MSYFFGRYFCSFNAAFACCRTVERDGKSAGGASCGGHAGSAIFWTVSRTFGRTSFQICQIMKQMKAVKARCARAMATIANAAGQVTEAYKSLICANGLSIRREASKDCAFPCSLAWNGGPVVWHPGDLARRRVWHLVFWQDTISSATHQWMVRGPMVKATACRESVVCFYPGDERKP